ncbi:MAG: acyl carrier protein [bacterium]|nr:acyl carrier protein [bacterium]
MLEKLETELKGLIIDALVLEDVTVEEIDSSEPLFGEGLGLDSIDALEIAMALEQHYGATMSEDDDEIREHFACVRSLAKFVDENRAQA